MFINKVVRFLNWEFNPSNNTLNWLGKDASPNGSLSIELEAKQALLLSYLISIQGQIASREALQKHIWFDRYVDDKTINATISKLRRALGGDTKSIIKTHPKQGYSFTPNVLSDKSASTMHHSFKFKAMLSLYKELQEVKQMVIDKLDHLEEFRTFVQTEKGYKVTTPEGYVLHKDGSMIKFVNRLEFAYNNFTLQKQWR